jgi:hypothetical protein
MRLRGGSVVRSVGGIFSTQRLSGRPALAGQNTVPEALGVVGPGRVLGIIGEFGAAVEAKKLVGGLQDGYLRSRSESLLFLFGETHFDW